MKKKRNIYSQVLAGALILLLSGLNVNQGTVQAQGQQAVLQSPDGQIEMAFTTGEDSESGTEPLLYSVSYKGNLLIDASELELHLEGEVPLGSDVSITRVGSSENNTETYQLVAGKTSSVTTHYNTLSVELEENTEPGRRLVIEARAYNDGAALRYVIPEQPGLSNVRLSDERTSFSMTDDAIAYALVLPHFESMYESEFIRLPLSAFANQGGVSSEALIGLPVLLEMPGAGWLAVIDADLSGYAGSYVTNPTGSWTGHELETRLAPQLENPEVAVTGSLPFQTSWKAIMIADHPGRFTESTLITSLNPPSEIQDLSWIRGGKVAWDWWSGSLDSEGNSAYTTENMKYYVDFAAESGFEYMLIDAGWSGEDLTQPIEERVNVPEVAEYARKKDVDIWIWAYYEAVKEQMDEAFPVFEDWGVAGVKIDFVERDDQEGIEFYYETAEKAAEHHLMLDIHGSTKPTGIERTWPNVLGYEAVLGMEQSKAGRRDNPDHHVMLPYTRMISGLMDYTPGGFDNVTREEFVPRMINPMVTGTRAHHLAMYAVYDSPIQMVSDHPSAYRGEESFEFIKAVPTTWDETRFLNGRPGEYVTIARRNGNKWYLGSMTNWNERELNIPLSFLGEGEFRAVIYADHPTAGENPKMTTVKEKVVTSESELSVELAEGGGLAVEILPLD